MADAAIQDLTVSEAKAELTALANEIGSKAEVYAHLVSHHSRLLSGCINPYGILDRTSIRADGATWRELIDALREAWAEYADLHATNTIREMAVAIITITADLGECTDAALRAKFDGADVTRYGDRACEAATEMASNGPFSIVKLSGANDIAA